MPPSAVDLQKSWGEINEQFGAFLASLNDGPPSSQVPDISAMTKSLDGVGDNAQLAAAVQKSFMDADDMDAFREKLQTKSVRELNAIFTKQASRQDTGVPLHRWLSAGGYAAQERYAGSNGLHTQLAPDLAKAVDTTSASALIRQDLEPILYELFVRTFPLFDRIPRIPANGLVHAYNQMTSYGDADWIGELDTVTDDRGTYVRQITNVGILATRRGVSLKSQFAVLQGGAGFNPERLELSAGLKAMSSRYQKTILHGNWTDPAGTLGDQVGPYDDDSFDGLRKILNTGSAVNVDPATNPTTTGSIRRAIDAAVLPITEAGGTPSAIFGAPADQITFDEQQDDKLRILQQGGAQDTTVGVRATRISTIAGPLPFYGVPGGAISAYDPDTTYSAANTVRDLMVLDEDSLAIPYLGASGPTVLEIPIGVTGQLTHLFIIFFMGGLVVHAPTWNNKVRIKVS